MWKRPNLTLWSTLWIYRYSQCETPQFNIVEHTMIHSVIHTVKFTMWPHCESIVIHNVKTPQFNIVNIHTVKCPPHCETQNTLWNAHNVNLRRFHIVTHYIVWNYHTVKRPPHCDTSLVFEFYVKYFKLWKCSHVELSTYKYEGEKVYNQCLTYKLNFNRNISLKHLKLID